MTREEFADWIDEQDPDEKEPVIHYPDLEKAIIGVVERFGMIPVILYDRDKVIEILMKGGMSEDSAEEWFEFNTIGTWAGKGTPAFARLIQEESTNGQQKQSTRAEPETAEGRIESETAN